MAEQKNLTLSRLIMIARNRNVKGLINKKVKFKFEDGKMYVFNDKTESWVTPSITCSWFEHRYVEIKDANF